MIQLVSIEAEKKAVEKTIRKWYKAATDMDLDAFMEIAAEDFVLLNPGRDAILGKDGFRDFFYEYGGGSYGPVSLGKRARAQGLALGTVVHLTTSDAELIYQCPASGAVLSFHIGTHHCCPFILELITGV
jgi:hypothetical protein